jgi:hypothetical protein
MIPTKNEFDNTIHSILNRADYKHLKNSFRDIINNVKDNIKEAISKWIEKRFSSLGEAEAISDKLSSAFMIIGILAIVAIIIVIIVKINKTFERKRKVREILGEKIDDRTTPASLKQKASSFREAGDFRQAIRYDFIALLLLMHEKNLVYLDESKTNEEIYKYLRKNNFSMSDVFKNLGEMFNSTWYGNKTSGEQNYIKWSNGISLMWNEVIKHEG